jgi:hypothetical protein
MQGTSHLRGRQNSIRSQASAVEAHSFSISKQIAEFVISEIGETTINFGRTDFASVAVGSLDRGWRVGTSVLPPTDPAKQQNHQAAWLQLIAPPAGKMF